MNLKKELEEPLWAKHISQFWRSKITDLDSLKELLPGSMLIALDIEGIEPLNQGPNEIGLAFLRFDADSRKACMLCPGTSRFHDENKIQAHTIQIRDRMPTFNLRKREPLKYGSAVIVDAKQLGSTIDKILSKYTQESSNLILLGFSMSAEVKWIAQQCPSLSLHFAAWADLQEFAAERGGGRKLGLIHTLKAMGIRDWRPNRHRAANDAVRCLTALSGLISTDPSTFTVPQRHTELQYFSRLPKGSSLNNHPFAVRITTADGSKLPYEISTPHHLSKLFVEYEIKAVGLNANTELVRANGVKFWWISFRTLEALEEFVDKVNGSTLFGKTLSVENGGR